MELFKHYYPPIFVQGKHVSEIDKVTNKNDLRTHLYGLNFSKIYLYIYIYICQSILPRPPKRRSPRS